MYSTVIHAFLLAIGLILPLGVQNIYVFNQGAVRKRIRHALPVIITASMCDTFLILLAVLGVSAIVVTFSWMKSILVVCGFIFLLYMGFQSWRTRVETYSVSSESDYSLPKVVGFTLMISLLNPHAILDTVGVIGTSSIRYKGTEKILFTSVCIIVSWIWFFLLALTGRYIGSMNHSNPRILWYVHKISAVAMWGAAIYLIQS
jgi:L-lysine exporter family protein LysE/ArgO